MKNDTCLVVPSIREESLARFIREWGPTGIFDRVDLVVIEDNPTTTFNILPMLDAGGPDFDPTGDFKHFSWSDIDRQPWSWIIPRRSDTVRSFGYWHAWKSGYDYLMTLDDDCYPAKGYEQLDLQHKSMLTRTRWFNTLNNVRPRGIPYFNTGKREVHVNHGIWQGVLDYDAPQQLVSPVPEIYTHDNRIVPYGAYHPFCGMNAIWRREAMPLSYHLLMGSHFGPAVHGGERPLKKFPFDRFGDIWSGIIQKKICDHLGWVVSSGTPYIHHDRASNPFTNLRKEANGIEVNEWFWERIDAIPLEFDTAAFCYQQVGQAVKEFGGEHSKYWVQLGDAMVHWSELFIDAPKVPALGYDPRDHVPHEIAF